MPSSLTRRTTVTAVSSADASTNARPVSAADDPLPNRPLPPRDVRAALPRRVERVRAWLGASRRLSRRSPRCLDSWRAWSRRFSIPPPSRACSAKTATDLRIRSRLLRGPTATESRRWRRRFNWNTLRSTLPSRKTGRLARIRCVEPWRSRRSRPLRREERTVQHVDRFAVVVICSAIACLAAVSGCDGRTEPLNPFEACLIGCRATPFGRLEAYTNCVNACIACRPEEKS